MSGVWRVEPGAVPLRGRGMSTVILAALLVWIVVLPAVVFLFCGFKYRRETRGEREQEQQARESLYPKVGGWRS